MIRRENKKEGVCLCSLTISSSSSTIKERKEKRENSLFSFLSSIVMKSKCGCSVEKTQKEGGEKQKYD